MVVTVLRRTSMSRTFKTLFERAPCCSDALQIFSRTRGGACDSIFPRRKDIRALAVAWITALNSRVASYGPGPQCTFPQPCRKALEMSLPTVELSFDVHKGADLQEQRIVDTSCRKGRVVGCEQRVVSGNDVKQTDLLHRN